VIAHDRHVATWLLAVIVFLIAFGSLYPFSFSLAGAGVIERLGELPRAGTTRSDVAANVLLYLPLGTCLAWGDGVCVVEPDGEGSHEPVAIPIHLIVSGKPVPPRASVSRYPECWRGRVRPSCWQHAIPLSSAKRPKRAGRWAQA